MLTRKDEIKVRLFDIIAAHGKNLSIVSPLTIDEAIMYTNYVYNKLFGKEDY